MTVLSKGCKPGNIKLHKYLKISFTNIRGLRSNIVECESFVESNPLDILDILLTCEANSVRGYLSLIPKDSITHVHGLALYVKKGLPFALDLSLENSLCFPLALL